MGCISVQHKCCLHSMVTVTYFFSLIDIKICRYIRFSKSADTSDLRHWPFSSVCTNRIYFDTNRIPIYLQEPNCTPRIQKARTPWFCPRVDELKIPTARQGNRDAISTTISLLAAPDVIIWHLPVHPLTTISPIRLTMHTGWINLYRIWKSICCRT